MKHVNEITFDLPIRHKELTVYPVTVRDYLSFNYLSQVFTLDKNRTAQEKGDDDIIKIITMTDLEYIYYCATEVEDGERNAYIAMFDRTLALVLKDDSEEFEDALKSITRYSYDENGKPCFYIGGNKYDSSDFYALREIIAEQNLLELPDDNTAREVTDAMEEARRFKNKMLGNKPGSFEDYIVSLSIVTGWTLERIYDMTIRKFLLSIRRMDNLIHYKIYLSASMSGLVEFKDKSFIKHWLTSLEEKDKFKDVSMDLDKVKDKISPSK